MMKFALLAILALFALSAQVSNVEAVNGRAGTTGLTSTTPYVMQRNRAGGLVTPIALASVQGDATTQAITAIETVDYLMFKVVIDAGTVNNGQLAGVTIQFNGDVAATAQLVAGTQASYPEFSSYPSDSAGLPAHNDWDESKLYWFTTGITGTTECDAITHQKSSSNRYDTNTATEYGQANVVIQDALVHPIQYFKVIKFVTKSTGNAVSGFQLVFTNKAGVPTRMENGPLTAATGTLCIFVHPQAWKLVSDGTSALQYSINANGAAELPTSTLSGISFAIGQTCLDFAVAGAPPAAASTYLNGACPVDESCACATDVGQTNTIKFITNNIVFGWMPSNVACNWVKSGTPATNEGAKDSAGLSRYGELKQVYQLKVTFVPNKLLGTGLRIRVQLTAPTAAQTAHGPSDDATSDATKMPNHASSAGWTWFANKRNVAAASTTFTVGAGSYTIDNDQIWNSDLWVTAVEHQIMGTSGVANHDTAIHTLVPDVEFAPGFVTHDGDIGAGATAVMGNALDFVGGAVVNYAALAAPLPFKANCQVVILGGDSSTTYVTGATVTNPATKASEAKLTVIAATEHGVFGRKEGQGISHGGSNFLYATTAAGYLNFGSSTPWVANTMTLGLASDVSSYVVGTKFRVRFGTPLATLGTIWAKTTADNAPLYCPSFTAGAYSIATDQTFNTVPTSTLSAINNGGVGKMCQFSGMMFQNQEQYEATEIPAYIGASLPVVSASGSLTLAAVSGWGSTSITGHSWMASQGIYEFSTGGSTLTSPWSTISSFSGAINGVIQTMQPYVIYSYIDETTTPSEITTIVDKTVLHATQSAADSTSTLNNEKTVATWKLLGAPSASQGTFSSVYGFWQDGGYVDVAQKLEIHFRANFEIKVSDRLIVRLRCGYGLGGAADLCGGDTLRAKQHKFGSATAAYAVTFTKVVGSETEWGLTTVVNNRCVQNISGDGATASSFATCTAAAGGGGAVDLEFSYFAGEFAVANVLAGAKLGFTIATEVGTASDAEPLVLLSIATLIPGKTSIQLAHYVNENLNAKSNDIKTCGKPEAIITNQVPCRFGIETKSGVTGVGSGWTARPWTLAANHDTSNTKDNAILTAPLSNTKGVIAALTGKKITFEISLAGKGAGATGEDVWISDATHNCEQTFYLALPAAWKSTTNLASAPSVVVTQSNGVTFDNVAAAFSDTGLLTVRIQRSENNCYKTADGAFYATGAVDVVGVPVASGAPFQNVGGVPATSTAVDHKISFEIPFVTNPPIGEYTAYIWSDNKLQGTATQVPRGSLAASKFAAFVWGGIIDNFTVAFASPGTNQITPGFSGAKISFTLRWTSTQVYTVGDTISIVLAGWTAAGGVFDAAVPAVGTFGTLSFANTACTFTSATDTLKCTLAGSGSISVATGAAGIAFEVTGRTNPSSGTFAASVVTSQCPRSVTAATALTVSGLNSNVIASLSNYGQSATNVVLSVQFTSSVAIASGERIVFGISGVGFASAPAGTPMTVQGFPVGATLQLVSTSSTRVELQLNGGTVLANTLIAFSVPGATNPVAAEYTYSIFTTNAPTLKVGATPLGIGQVTGVSALLNNNAPGAISTALFVKFIPGLNSAPTEIFITLPAFGQSIADSPTVLLQLTAGSVTQALSTTTPPVYNRNTNILTITTAAALGNAASEYTVTIAVAKNPPRGAYLVSVRTNKEFANRVALTPLSLSSTLSAATGVLLNASNGALNTVLTLGLTTSGTIVAGDTIAVNLEAFNTGIASVPVVSLLAGSFGSSTVANPLWNSATNVLTFQLAAGSVEINAGSMLSFSIPVLQSPITPGQKNLSFSVTGGLNTASALLSVVGVISDVKTSISNNTPAATTTQVTVSWNDSAALKAGDVIKVVVANFGGGIVAQTIANGVNCAGCLTTLTFPNDSTIVNTAGTAVWNSSSNVLTITLSTATIADNARYQLVIPVANNPGIGSYAVTVESSVSSVAAAVQAVNPIPIGGVTAVSVSMSNAFAGSTNSFVTVGFTTPIILPIGTTIDVVITGFGGAIEAPITITKVNGFGTTTLTGTYTSGTGRLIVTTATASIGANSVLSFFLPVKQAPIAGTYPATVKTSASPTPSGAEPPILIAGAISAVTLATSDATPGASNTELTVCYTDSAVQSAGGSVTTVLSGFGNSISLSPLVQSVSGFGTTSFTQSAYDQSTGFLTFLLATAGVAAGTPVCFKIPIVSNPSVGPYGVTVQTSSSPQPLAAAVQLTYTSIVSAVTSTIDNNSVGAATTSLIIGFTDSSTLAVNTLITITISGFGTGIPTSPAIVPVGTGFGSTTVTAPAYVITPGTSDGVITFRLATAALAANTPVQFTFTVTSNPNDAGCKAVTVKTDNALIAVASATSVDIGATGACGVTTPTPTPVSTDPLPPVTAATHASSLNAGGGSAGGSAAGNQNLGKCDYNVPGAVNCSNRATIIDCQAYNGIAAANLVVRLDMGVYSDFYRPAGGTNLCALLSTTFGGWYEHSVDGINFTVARGDDTRLLGGGAPARGRSAPVGPYWGAIADGMPAGGCGHVANGDAFACGIAFTFRVSVVDAYAPYAKFNGLYKAKATTFTQGLGAPADVNFVRPCGDYAAVQPNNLMVRLTMGAYVDYFKPTASLCAMLTNVGQWYWVATNQTGPWTAINGNHDALLGGFNPIAPDTRQYGPFWGSPDGPTGYDGEAGGCCHAAAGDAVQFWRAYSIDVRVY